MKILHCWRVLLFLTVSLAWSAFAAAAVVKNVYTGTQFMTAASVNVALGTPVVTAKSFVICQIQNGGLGSNMSECATCDLTGPATLQIQVGALDATENVRWYVVEFLSGVFVQRGNTPLAVLTTAVNAAPALAAVNLLNAFVLISERSTTAGAPMTAQNSDEQACVQAQLTSTTNLQLTRNDAATTAIMVAWQVVEIDSAFVQRGVVPIVPASTTATVNLTIGGLFPVHTARTFLVFTRQGATAIAGDETLYQVTGDINATGTTLTFTRGRSAANTQIDISWFLVRMTDGTVVQRGTVTPAAATTATVDVALANNPGLVGIATLRSIPILSVRDIAGSAQTADLDETSWAGTFTTATNLRLTKTSSNQFNSTIAWQVVQFNNTTNTIDRVEIVP